MLSKIYSTVIILIAFFASETSFAQTTRVNNLNHQHSVAERTPGNGNGNGNNLVAICHQLGNGGSNTIYVAQAAVQAHLNHGDYLGTCQDDDSEDDNDDNNDDGDDNNDDGDDNNDDGDENNDDGDDNNDDGDDNDDSSDNGDDSEPVTPSCTAVEVVSFFPGTKNDLLTPVDANRLDASKALGTPEDSDVTSNEFNFVSLGFGGEITLKFAYPIHNGEGDDLYVVETTFGSNAQNCSRYPEKIRAFGSQDGCNWIWLGDGCQNTFFDFKTLGWIQYVKLIDISPIDHPFGGAPADGYDLDGVICLHGEELNPIPAAFDNQFASSVVSYNAGTTKGGSAVQASRSNPANALGAPQNTDVVNFVSLGFGGTLTLGFDYVIFDKAGNDIQIIETSYGNPTCTNYPETARIEVSLDNENWFMVDGNFCLDQAIDISSAGLPMFSYIKIMDASAMSSTHFPSSADGYDVDGVVVLQPACNVYESRLAIPAATSTSASTSATVYPNPFADQVTVEFATGDVQEQVTVRVINTLGQTIATENFNSNGNATVNKSVNMSNIKSGMYFLTIERNDTIESFRIVKK